MPITQDQLETQIEIFLTSLGEHDLVEVKKGLCSAWALSNFMNDVLGQEDTNIIRMNQLKDIDAKAAGALYEEYKRSYTNLINEKNKGVIAPYNRKLDEMYHQCSQLRSLRDEKTSEQIAFLEIEIKNVQAQRSQVIEELLAMRFGKIKLMKMHEAENLYFFIHALHGTISPSKLNYYVDKGDSTYKVKQDDYIELSRLIIPPTLDIKEIPIIHKANEIAFTFSHYELINIFNNKIPNTINEGDMIRLAIPGHAFYLSYKSGQFSLYNPDLEYRGKNVEELVSKIESIYSKQYNKELDYISLRINIFNLEESVRPNRIDIINEILIERQKKGNNIVNAISLEQDSALNAAVKSGHIDTVKLLLDKNPNIDKLKNIPLKEAIINSDVKMVTLLVNYDESSINQNINGITPFFQAVALGEKEIVETLLKSNIYIKTQVGDNKTTVAHIAAANNQIEIIKILHENGIDCNMKNKSGFFPIHFAAIHGHIDIIQTLIDLEKIDLYRNRDRLIEIAVLAAKHGHFKVIEFLNTKYKISVNASFMGDTLSMHAAKEGRVEFIKEFHKKNEIDYDYQIELAYQAASRNHLNVASYFNIEIFTLMMKAARDGDVHFIKNVSKNYMLSDKELTSLVFFAAKHGKFKIIDFLDDKYRFRFSRTNFDGETLATQAIVEKRFDILQYLVDKRILLTSANERGWTPLHLAIHYRDPQLIHVIANDDLRTITDLIEAKIRIESEFKLQLAFIAASQKNTKLIKQLNLDDLTACNKYGESLATHAAKNGNNSLIEYLIESKIDFSKPDARGVTPAYVAAQWNESTILHKIAKYNPRSINVSSGDLGCPIHISILTNNIPALKVLLKNGADIEAVTKINYGSKVLLCSPLGLAILSNNIEAIHNLLEKGANFNNTYNKVIIEEAKPKTLSFLILYQLKHFIEDNKLDTYILPSKQLERIKEAEKNQDWEKAMDDIMRFAIKFTSHLIKNSVFNSHDTKLKTYLHMFSSRHDLLDHLMKNMVSKSINRLSVNDNLEVKNRV